jgi:Arc/MetJ-type ribon-helix-helix transcriptional regulator
MVTTKNKAQLNSTVSPWIKKRIEEMVQTDDFSSISDVVSQALSEFIGRYDEKKSREGESSVLRPASLDASYFQTLEGKALIKSIIRESLSQPEPTKKKPVVVHTSEYVTDDIIGKEIK